MIKILQQFDLSFQTRNHSLRSLILFVRERSRHFDLLDCNRFTRCHTERDVDVTIGTSADQVSFDPFVGDCVKR